MLGEVHKVHRSDVPIAGQDLLKAEAILRGVTSCSPVLTSRIVDETVRAEVFFKCENFQHSGSFKFRGSFYALERLDETQKRLGVVVPSPGNYARAVALSGKMLKIPSIILMSSDMPREAITLMQEYGSEIVFYNERMEKKDKILDELIGKFGWTLMPSYDYRESVIGYATLIKELIDEVGPLDYLFASVGSGGLISACAIAASYYSPECLVVGVKCGDQNFGSLSCTSGLMSYAPYPMADEGWVHTIGHPTLSIVRSYVRDVVMVAEEAAHAQMRFFAERMKILVEPMGSLAAAAVLNKIVDVSGKRVGVIVSGGNVPLHAFSGILRKI